MSIMRLSRPCIYLACTLLALLSAVLRAQAPDSSIKIGPDATPKLPADACFYATVHVKEIVAMKELQLVPWEIITAAGLDQMGFDPLAVERIDLILALGEESRPQIAFVARTNQKIEIKPEAAKDLLDKSGYVVIPLNERFVVVGDFEFIKRVVNGPVEDGELKRQVARIGDSSIAWCAFVTSPVQKQLNDLATVVPEDRRGDLLQIVQKTKLLAARYDMKTQSIPVVFEAANEADAIAVDKAFANVEQIMRKQFDDRVQSLNQGFAPSVDKAIMNFANRYQQDFVRVMRPVRNGQRLTLKMDQEFFDVMQMDSSLVAISAVLRGVEASMGKGRQPR